MCCLSLKHVDPSHLHGKLFDDNHSFDWKSVDLMTRSDWCLSDTSNTHQTLWGRALSPEILPCWWPCRSRFPRRPAGCCGWSACSARPPACWRRTAPTAPAAALSCTKKKKGEWAEEETAADSHPTVTYYAASTLQHVWCYRCIISALWISTDPTKQRLSADSLTLKLFLSIARKQVKTWQDFL